MANEYSDAEAVEQIASGLIPNHHPELATARMMYCFREKAASKGGLKLHGKARKLSGFTLWALDKDFVIEVALELWNDLEPAQRTAVVDELLERCTGEEQEDGSMKWGIREPEIQTFASIVQRHGAWNEGLRNFVSVAQSIELDEIIEEEAEIDIDDLVDQHSTE